MVRNRRHARVLGASTPWRGDPMSSEVQVPITEKPIDNSDHGRFELSRHGELVGCLFRAHVKPNRYALLHTEVGPSHQHQGVVGAMVRRVLDAIHSREGTITVMCPFVAEYFSRTITFADLIEARYPGHADCATAELARAQAIG